MYHVIFTYQGYAYYFETLACSAEEAETQFIEEYDVYGQSDIQCTIKISPLALAPLGLIPGIGGGAEIMEVYP